MLEKKKSLKRLIVLILSFTMILGAIPSVSFADTERSNETPKGYITLSVEKFVLGQGFLVEPEEVPYYEGETLGKVIYRTLGADNVKGTISNGNISYLAGIRDEDNSEVVLPDSLKGTVLGSKNNPDWLSEKDYTSGAGWMYKVNNISPNVGMSSYTPNDGDVIRLNFVISYTNASENIDALLTKLALINSSADKSTLLADAKLKAAYDNANKVAADYDVTAEEVNSAYETLVNAMPKGDTYSLTYDGNGAIGSVTDNTKYAKNDIAVVASSDELYCPEEKYFSCWNTEADGTGTTYMPGEKIRFVDKNVTLYAIWDNEYSVTYDVNKANGGGTTVAPTDTATYFPGRSVTLKTISIYSQKPEAGLTFVGWNTKADGTGDFYAGSSKMVMPKGNVTLYAMWKNGYKVTYNLNGGTGTLPSDTTLYAAGSEFKAKSCSAKNNNQKFTAWNTEADGSGQSYKYNEVVEMTEGGITLYAQYKDAYTITYDINGGSGSISQPSAVYIAGETCTAYSGNSLSKDGTMAFKEWNTQADGSGTSYGYNETITFGNENIILYAQYEQGYHITYDLNDGTGVAPTDTTVYGKNGSAYLKSTNGIIAPEGKKFYCWNTEKDGTGTSYTTGSVTFNGADFTLYAIYGPELKLYRVDSEGANPVQVGTTTYAKGASVYLSSYSVTPPSAPEGKVFMGWTTDVNSKKTVTSVNFEDTDITIYAVYSNGLTLKYDLNGGSGEIPTDANRYGGSVSATLADGSVITPPDGKSFIKWNTKADGTGTAYSSKQGWVNVNTYISQGLEELTLHAIYATPYTVTYDTNGGSAVTDSKVYYDGNSVTISSTVPTKDGTTFVRWNTKADGTGKDYKPGERLTVNGGNITLYARWAQNSISYDGNGEDVSMPTDSNLYSANVEVTTSKPSVTLAPSGKRFMGWNTKADGSGTTIKAGDKFNMPKADIKLYAVWGTWEDVIDNGIQVGENYCMQNAVYTYGDEWTIFSMLRSGGTISDANKDKYYKSVVNEIKTNARFSKKSTNISRTILGLQASGIDASNVGGVNLLAMLYNYNDSLETMGANDVAFALIALDSNKTEIPEDANWSRDRLVNTLLKYQVAGGGFSLSMPKTRSDDVSVDITAMSLTALAPYSDDKNVKAAIDAGMKYLKDNMDEDAGYGNSNSVAQVITATSAIGIDFMKESNGFTVGDDNMLQNLDSYRIGSSGYKYLSTDAGVNGMATQQALYALEAYSRFTNGENSLYDLTDVTIAQYTELKDETGGNTSDANNASNNASNNAANAGNTGNGSNGVQTGDNNSVTLWIVLMLMAASSVAIVGYRRKEER